MLLLDRDIRKLITEGLLEINGVRLAPDSPLIAGPPSLVQPSSLDLTMGLIYLPETGESESGGVKKPLTYYRFPPGSTAIIETRETVRMPATVAGFGFPPTEVSTAGILMTNPGHVDPGYKGTLKFTVINMSRQEFDLKEGKRIVTLLLSNIAQPDKDWGELHPDLKQPLSGVDESQTGRLFKDFLDVQRRAETVAEKQALQIKGLKGWAAILGVLVTGLTAYCGATQTLEGRITRLEAANDIAGLRATVDSIVRARSKGGTPGTGGAKPHAARDTVAKPD